MFEHDERVGTVDSGDYSKYIDLDALFEIIKNTVQKDMTPLKPVEVFQLLKNIYEVDIFIIINCFNDNH